MITAWLIFCAMAAGAGDRPAPPVVDRARPAQVATLGAHRPAPSRSLSVARKARHRAGSGSRTWNGPEDCDADEEVDETSHAHLDAVATAPGPWMIVAWSGVGPGSRAVGPIILPPRSYFPLRC